MYRDLPVSSDSHRLISRLCLYGRWTSQERMMPLFTHRNHELGSPTTSGPFIVRPSSRKNVKSMIAPSARCAQMLSGRTKYNTAPAIISFRRPSLKDASAFRLCSVEAIYGASPYKLRVHVGTRHPKAILTWASTFARVADDSCSDSMR